MGSKPPLLKDDLRNPEYEEIINGHVFYKACGGQGKGRVVARPVDNSLKDNFSVLD